MKDLQSIRGMHDVLPEQAPVWTFLEARFAALADSYGYSEIRTPVLESTSLFKRSIGDVTDIIEKEMYSFVDRNGEELSLRPEGTAGVVRAVLEHGLANQRQQRLWYRGAMFRHERPQKGRYRQFHQMGLESFGWSGPEIEAELLAFTARLFRELDLGDLRLELNTLGSIEERLTYRTLLLKYLREHRDALDPEAQGRMEENPLRLFDSKNADTRAVMATAPRLMDVLGVESRQHFERLTQILDALEIAWTHNPSLVRGLDYYSHTVFEWITESLGAQGTICAGGRYDGLVEQLGGKPTPAVGLALGVERVVALLEARGVDVAIAPLAYVAILDPERHGEVLAWVEGLRNHLSTRSATTMSPVSAGIIVHAGDGSIKSQMKKADRSGARFAILAGGDEWTDGNVVLKPLRDDSEQRVIALNDAPAALECALAEVAEAGAGIATI
ncbi:MAG: histidine--tRNA ligase [Thioalkalivibrionaceae bacterium]